MFSLISQKKKIEKNWKSPLGDSRELRDTNYTKNVRLKEEKRLEAHKKVLQRLPDDFEKSDYILEFKVTSSIKPILYQVRLGISKNSVTKVGCDCTAGASLSCVHVRYALHYSRSLLKRGQLTVYASGRELNLQPISAKR